MSQSRIGNDWYAHHATGGASPYSGSFAPPVSARRVQLEGVVLSGANISFCTSSAAAFTLTTLASRRNVFAAWHRLHELDIPLRSNWDSYYQVPYKHAERSPRTFDRVGYHLQLDKSWAWASVEAFTHDHRKVGVPANTNIKKQVYELSVRSNVKGVGGKKGGGVEDGSLEFWGHCYSPIGPNANLSTGAKSPVFDDDDAPVDTGCPAIPNCYGSMQVHSARGAVFGFNGWSSSNKYNALDLGIGPNTNAAGHADWTYSRASLNHKLRTLSTYARYTNQWRIADPTELVFSGTSGKGTVDKTIDDNADTSWTVTAKDAEMHMTYWQLTKITGLRVLTKKDMSPATARLWWYETDAQKWVPLKSMPFAVSNTDDWQEWHFQNETAALKTQSTDWKVTFSLRSGKSSAVVREVRLADDGMNQRNLALNAKYSTSSRKATVADDKDTNAFPDGGSMQLTNGDVQEDQLYGVGFSFRNAEVTIDLGSEYCISSVLVNVATGDGGVDLPRSVDVGLSGAAAGPFRTIARTDVTGHGKITKQRTLHWLEVSLNGAEGRFVRVNAERMSRWVILNEVKVMACTAALHTRAFDTLGFSGGLWLDVPLDEATKDKKVSPPTRRRAHTITR